MKKIIFIFLLALGSITHAQEVTTTIAFPNLTFEDPIDIQNANDGLNRLFVAERGGVIHAFNNDSSVASSTEFLNISDKVTTSGFEQGLLGFAFHPNYSENKFIFVNYTRASDGATVVSRFQVVSEVAVPESEEIFMTIRQPFSNHNGGQIAFGPDGFLYISVGDGGSAGDPRNRAQNRKSLLGKMLRIDVDSEGVNNPYSIPSSNPYARNSQRFKKEIFAYGLRNTWRFSFDSETGKLWGADVGQDSFEEVNIIRRGKNYGWRLFEGRSEFNCPEPACSNTRVRRPVYQYSHDVGSSITGGYVYHGSLIPNLQNLYIFADFVTGIIFSLTTEKPFSANLVIDTELLISTFGLDESGEIYFADYNSGKIYMFSSSM
jgi:glucose/arabinose dehydrogenase